MTDLKVGDKVIIRDNPFILRVDKLDHQTPDPSINLKGDVVEVIRINTHDRCINLFGVVHDIFVKDNLGRIFLHTSRFVKKVEETTKQPEKSPDPDTLTIRDKFALAALVSIRYDENPTYMVESAYIIADEMIKQR